MGFGDVIGGWAAEKLLDLTGLNKKEKKAEDPASYTAPGMLPEQKGILDKVTPIVEGFMTKPPTVSSKPIQKTNVSIGGKFAYTPGSSGAFGTTNTAQPATAAPPVPTASVPNQTQSQASSASSAQTVQPQPTTQNFPTNPNGFYGNGPNDPLKYYPMQGVDAYFQGGNPASLGGSASSAASSGAAPATNTAGSTGANGQNFDINPGSVNFPDSPTFAPTYGTEGGYTAGPDNAEMIANYMAPINLPEYASYKGLPNQQPQIDALGQPLVNSSMDEADLIKNIGTPIKNGPNAGFHDFDQTQKLTDLATDLNKPDNWGAKEFDQTAKINAFSEGITNPVGQFSDYQNPLEKKVQDLTEANMTGNKLQEGYDASYLNGLKKQGMDPLTESYKTALDKQDAAANRTGLRSSSFNNSAKFGNQEGSITRNFLNQAENLNREIALKGAEAEREDRFKNRNLQDTALLNAGLTLSGRQSADQLARGQADINTGVTNKSLQGQGIGMASGQNAQQNAQNFQWAQAELERGFREKGYDAESAQLLAQQFAAKDERMQAANQQEIGLAALNKGFAGQELDAKTKQFGVNQASELINKNLAENALNMSNNRDIQGDDRKAKWAGIETDNAALNKDITSRGINLRNADFQRDEGNKLNWGKFRQTQAERDALNKQLGYQNDTNMGQWLTNREDRNLEGNQKLDLDLQDQNIKYQQAAIDKMIALYTGMNPASNAANENYWKGQNAANTAATNNNSTYAGLGGIIANAMAPTNYGSSSSGIGMNDVAYQDPYTFAPWKDSRLR